MFFLIGISLLLISAGIGMKIQEGKNQKVLEETSSKLEEYKQFTSELEQQYEATYETLKAVFQLLPKEMQESLKVNESKDQQPIIRVILNEAEEEALLDEEPTNLLSS